MIIGIFRDAIGWFVNLTEVGVVIAVILLVAVVVGMTGFWILSRFMRKLAGPPTELETCERIGRMKWRIRRPPNCKLDRVRTGARRSVVKFGRCAYSFQGD